MNTRTWVWKEFREQGPLVALVVGLSLAVAGGLAYWALVAENNQLVYSRQLPLILGVLLGGAGLTASLLGANAIAGERESGTLPFLEHLAGGRAAVWRAKVLFAVLGTLAAVTLTFGAMLFTRPEWDFFAWSLALVATLLGGTLFFSSFARSTLAACGMTVGSLLALAFSSAVAIGWFEFGQGANQTRTFVLLWTAAWCVPALLGALVGRRIYCGDELFDRPQSAGTVPRRRWWPATQSWPRVLWLVWRQGSWTLVAVPMVAVLLASMAGRANDGRASEPLAEVRLIYRPLLLIVLGIFVGVGAFSGDNTNEARRLWADARLPAGRMWLAKLLFWLAWAVAIAAVSARWLLREYAFNAAGFLVLWTRALAIDAVALLTGIAVSTLVVMCVRKSAAAFTLALLLAVPVAAIWLPSLLMGDFRAWVALGPAVALLASARWLVWPWVCGTLGEKRGRWRFAGGIGAALALTVAALSYRASSVPALPASVRSQFPTTWTWSSETSSSVSSVETRFYDHIPYGASVSTIVALSEAPGALAFDDLLQQPQPLESELWRAWLDRAPAVKVEGAEAAGGAEMGGGGKGGGGGMDIVDGDAPASELPPAPPRRTSLEEQFPPEVAARISAWTTMPATSLGGARRPTTVVPSQLFTRWLLLRDLELVERGRSAEALDMLLGTLALTRFERIEAHSREYAFAIDAERVALAIFERWLQRQVQDGPDAALLSKVSAGLAHHARQLPPPRTVIDGLWLRMHEPGALQTAHFAANPFAGESSEAWDVVWLAPWEAQRRDRITDWAFDGWAAAFTAFKQDMTLVWYREWTPSAAFAASGMSPQPFATTATENLGGVAAFALSGPFLSTARLQAEARVSRANVQAAQILVACVQFRQAEGSYPGSLDQLFPKFLPDRDEFAFRLAQVEGRPALSFLNEPPYRAPGGYSRDVEHEPDDPILGSWCYGRQIERSELVFPLPEWSSEK